MQEKVLVQHLRIGMYVADLDRPWVETPFLFQGFAIDSTEQIEEIARYCKFVYIDEHPDSSKLTLSKPFLATDKKPAGNISVQPPLKRPGQGAAYAEPASAVNIRARPLPERVVIYEDKVKVEKELVEAKKVHQTARQLVKTIIEDLRGERNLNAGKVTAAIEGMVESIMRNPDALLLLTKLKDKDTDSYGHALDVAIYMLAFGRHLGFPKEQLNILGAGGLLQDIGKLRLPSELLKKKEKLTAEEYKQVKSHIRHSISILQKMSGIPAEVIDLVATHHERQDGSGYPLGLTGEDISTFGSMAAIVDCFSALTNDRPYASAVSAREALEILYAWRGKYLHGGLLERFVQCIGLYPVGSLVELNTGEVAVVIAQNRVYHFKPRMILILDAQKTPYKNPTALDLQNDPRAADGKPYQIRKPLESGMYGIEPQQYYL